MLSKEGIMANVKVPAQCSLRKESWQMLRFLHNETDHPWLCSGILMKYFMLMSKLGGGGERQE
jgi:hypothetical protein